jgi:hypothetical protein
MFGPSPKNREKLERVIRAGIDLIEFSMDAGDAELRPPRGGMSKPPKEWWDRQVSNVTAVLEMRKHMLAQIN